MTLFGMLTGCVQAYYQEKGEQPGSQTRVYERKLTRVSFSDGFRSEQEAVFIDERVVMETVQHAVHFLSSVFLSVDTLLAVQGVA